MLALGSLLSQFRPGDTANTTVFTATVNTEITLITVVNTSGAPANFRVFHDDIGGSTFDETTAIFWDTPVNNASEPYIFQSMSEGSGIIVGDSGQIAVRSSVGNALTFNLYGVTESIAPQNR